MSDRSPDRRRVRPGEPGWPDESAWRELGERVGGRLIRLRQPGTDGEVSRGPGEVAAIQSLRDPYELGDDPALTQASGYLDAWRSTPGAYVVAAAGAADVAAAVSFARDHDLRVVVKGGGHSYQGTSSSPDSLVIWTRAMNGIELIDDFLAVDADPGAVPEPAVRVGAGAIWMTVYNAVTTRAGRYVQGGGCMTVGVAGLIQGGGFGSFSKAYGLAAAGLLEAEVVTADATVRVINRYVEPDLFWALKGGGGGTFGVVTRVTLRTRSLPQTFGEVSGTLAARSDEAFRRLLGRIIEFYSERLFNRRWGEQIRVTPDNRVRIGMVFQGLSRAQAEETWQAFADWVAGAGDIDWETPLAVVALPAARFWDADTLAGIDPDGIVLDRRPDRRPGEFFWAGNRNEAGWFLHGYRSVWLSATLLAPDRRASLADALFAASRHWTVQVHFNKGLAGAPREELAAAAATAINPIVLDAFALAVIIAEGSPAFLGRSTTWPDIGAARTEQRLVGQAFDELLRVVLARGAYVSESDYFEPRWQTAFWGANYARLADVKRRYDPDGLFVTHHGVGSEDWDADGFTMSQTKGPAVTDMTRRDLLDILARFEASGVRAWLDGGWGVDALLGRQTRRHRDLDLVVALDDVPRLYELLAATGYRLIRGVPEGNAVFRDEGGREIDVHAVHFDTAGNGIYRMENGEDWIFQPAGFLGVGRVGSRSVACLTAEQQMIDHATGYEPGPTDFHDMRLLHERLGTALLPPYDAPRSAPPGRSHA